MKTLVAVVLLSAAASSLSAYLLPSFTYEDMFAESDLVVIARPVSSRDTGERKLDRNVNPPVPVAGARRTVGGRVRRQPEQQQEKPDRRI